MTVQSSAIVHAYCGNGTNAASRGPRDPQAQAQLGFRLSISARRCPHVAPHKLVLPAAHVRRHDALLKPYDYPNHREEP